jgi:hypothetical protein
MSANAEGYEGVISLANVVKTRKDQDKELFFHDYYAWSVYLPFME